jgi:hypothetical protein
VTPELDDEERCDASGQRDQDGECRHTQTPIQRRPSPPHRLTPLILGASRGRDADGRIPHLGDERPAVPVDARDVNARKESPLMLKNRRAIVLTVLSLSIGGVLAGLALGASSGNDTIPSFDATLTPNWISPLDSASANYQNLWVYPTSPSTPYRSPDSQHQVQRYLLLDPRVTDSDGHRGNDDWWFVIQRYWPSSYPAQNHGDWGSEVNFHNVAGDAGPANSGGVGWGFGSGVSSLALCWPPNDPTPVMNVEPNAPNNELALPSPSRDTWHTYVVHFVAGRTDGSTVHPGAITVWADGADTPVINKTNINTVQRAKGPDGNSYTQQWMQLWEGDYTRNLQTKSTVRFALTRIGNTLSAALNDRPSVAATNASGQYYRGSGTNLGASSISSAGGLSASAAAVPQSLGGSGATGSPTPATTVAATTTTTTSATTTTTTTTTSRGGRGGGGSSSGGTGGGSGSTGSTGSGGGHTGSAGSGGGHTGGLAPADDARTTAASPTPVRWDGKAFDDWHALRSHLSRRGVKLNRFLVQHPTVVSRLGLEPVHWDGKTFFLRSEFNRWLKHHRVEAGSWSKRHPALLARLS